MNLPAQRPSQRDHALDACLVLLREGKSLSLESAARAAGMSKPGLMYHFPTKEALLAGLLDHVFDDYEKDFAGLLAAPSEAPTVQERLTAYVTWAINSSHDAADLVMLVDPKLREAMTTRWADRLREWVDVPEDLPPPDRARLIAVRFIADGCWFADATGLFPVDGADRPALLATALDLLQVGER